jgi:tetratricopeptide (TPR) repeat protein
MGPMRALIASLLVVASVPLTAGVSLSAAALLVSQPAVRAMAGAAVAQTARAITVRIEGAGSPGSGVLVRRDGQRYEVLTAWHVVSAQQPGEQLDVITPDGRTHAVVAGSIARVATTDLATLSFVSELPYATATLPAPGLSPATIAAVEAVTVAGFPLNPAAQRLTISHGDFGGSSQLMQNDGYQLYYFANTLAGMSGGPVLDQNGTLIAIHGRGETSEMSSRMLGRQEKTGVNWGLPIRFYLDRDRPGPAAVQADDLSGDDYFLMAWAEMHRAGGSQEKLRQFLQASLERRETNGMAHYLLAMFGGLAEDRKAQHLRRSLHLIGRSSTAMSSLMAGGIESTLCSDSARAMQAADARQAVAAPDCSAVFLRSITTALDRDPGYGRAYYLRAALTFYQDRTAALADYARAIELGETEAYRSRAGNLAGTDPRQALSDLEQYMQVYPGQFQSYLLRASINESLGDHAGAAQDYGRFIDAFDREVSNGYLNTLMLTELDRDLYYRQMIATALEGRSRARMKLGERAAALSDYDAAIARFEGPGSSRSTGHRDALAGLYFRRSELRKSLGMIGESCADLKVYAQHRGNDAGLQMLIQERCAR